MISGEKNDAWQDKRSEHSRTLRFHIAAFWGAIFQGSHHMCLFLTVEEIEEINNLRGRFFRDEFTPNRSGVGGRREEAEIH